MRNLLLICLIGLIFTISACKGKNDVLATFKNGKITRGELYDWLEVNNFNRESVEKNKNMVKSKIESILTERISIIEAEKDGFDKTSEFKMLSDMTTESQLINLVYNREVVDKAVFKERAVRISQIVLRANYAPDKSVEKKTAEPKDIVNVTNRARVFVDSIERGEKFQDIAAKQSEDLTKKNGGDAGFIIPGMVNQAITNAAFALKIGEYTRKPIVVDNSVYIIKVTDIKEITQKNIEKIIDDKSQAARIKSILIKKLGDDYINNLKKSAGVSVSLDMFKSSNKNEIIFKFGDIVYTVDDFNKRIALITNNLNNGSQPLQKFTDEQKKMMVENILKYELLNRVAVQRGIDKDPEFVKKIQLKRDSLLAREYMKKIGKTSGSKLTETEIKEEYDRNRDNKYFTMVRKGDKTEKVIEPFSNVKDSIAHMLYNIKISDGIKIWKEKMMTEYAVTVNENEF